MKGLIESYKHIFTHPDNFGQLVGYKLLEIEPGRSRTSLSIQEKHISPSGVTHGGVLSTFVDFSMGAALFLALPKGHRCSTIEFKINYISGVRLGETIVGDAKIKYLGKSHAVMECHVFKRKEKDRKDVAMALGTYNIYPVHSLAQAKPDAR
jgi:acyl-CoA thioesterase